MINADIGEFDDGLPVLTGQTLKEVLDGQTQNEAIIHSNSYFKGRFRTYVAVAEPNKIVDSREYGANFNGPKDIYAGYCNPLKPKDETTFYFKIFLKEGEASKDHQD